MGQDGDTISGVEERLRLDPPGSNDTLVIAVGVNDLLQRRSWVAVRAYAHLLGTLPKTGRVIVSAVLPVTTAPKGSKGLDHEAASAINRSILEFNPALHVLALYYGAEFVDAREAMVGEDGWLRGESAVDGVHLTRAGYLPWTGVLRAHVFRFPCGDHALPMAVIAQHLPASTVAVGAHGKYPLMPVPEIPLMAVEALNASPIRWPGLIERDAEPAALVAGAGWAE